MEQGEEPNVAPAPEHKPEEILCDACGTANTEQDEVCRNCGEALWEDAEGEEGREGWKPLIIGGVLAAVVLVLFLWKPWAKTPAPGTSGSTQAPASSPANEIHELAQDGDLIWVGTSGGLFAYDRKSLARRFEKTDGLLHPFVDALTVDHKGVKWVGCFGGGLNTYDGATWGVFDPGVTKGATVVSSFEDRQGILWFATDAAGLFSYDGKSFTQYTTAEGLPNNQVHTIAQDLDDSIWVGTTDGVGHLKDKKWKVYRTQDGLAFNHVLIILVDKQGDKWFGTWTGGLSRFNGTKWTTYKSGPPPDGINSDYVLSGDIDSKGNLWFGTYDGVSMWDGTKFTQFRPAQGLLGTDVWATKVDSDGYKWFGTYKGVSRLDPEDKDWKTIVR